jgi:hypothetical protein
MGTSQLSCTPKAKPHTKPAPKYVLQILVLKRKTNKQIQKVRRGWPPVANVIEKCCIQKLSKEISTLKVLTDSVVRKSI